MHSRQREGASHRRDHAMPPCSGAALSAPRCVSADKYLGGVAGAGNKYVHQVRASLAASAACSALTPSESFDCSTTGKAALALPQTQTDPPPLLP